MDDAGVLIGAEFEALRAENQRLFEVREQRDTADRRLGSSDEQSMIAAGIEIDDGGGCETADAVGLEPLAAGSFRQIAADPAIELDRQAKAAPRQGFAFSG